MEVHVSMSLANGLAKRCYRELKEKNCRPFDLGKPNLKRINSNKNIKQIKQIARTLGYPVANHTMKDGALIQYFVGIADASRGFAINVVKIGLDDPNDYLMPVMSVMPVKILELYLYISFHALARYLYREQTMDYKSALLTLSESMINETERIISTPEEAFTITDSNYPIPVRKTGGAGFVELTRNWNSTIDFRLKTYIKMSQFGEKTKARKANRINLFGYNQIMSMNAIKGLKG